MVEGLALTGHAAEEVLDRTGDAGELMSLHLGEVDDPVTGVDGLGNRELGDDLAPAVIHTATRGEVDKLGPTAEPGLDESGALGGPDGTIEPRGIAEADGSTPLLEETSGGGQDGGMRSDDFVGVVTGKEIRFEKEPLAGGDEAIEPTKKLDAAADSLVDEVGIIGRTADQRDGGLTHMAPSYAAGCRRRRRGAGEGGPWQGGPAQQGSAAVLP